MSIHTLVFAERSLLLQLHNQDHTPATRNFDIAAAHVTSLLAMPGFAGLHWIPVPAAMLFITHF